ncbi:MAG: ASKHA domain-containing protein, partial [candidate division WOR-3 bacterium]
SVTETETGSIYVKVKAMELNLEVNKNTQVYSPPIIGSHVGTDALAVGLSCGVFDDTEENIMCVDIGTNGEVILKTRGKLFATSCAAGSALEPMPAVPGAIYRFSIDRKKNKWKTIGNSRPVGVCGSGIIDILGELIKNGMMDEKGYLKGREVFKITDNIKLTQSDIKGEKGLLWSKAAVSLGIKALLEEANLTIGELDKFYLSGSFGNYIDKENARIVGLIPDIPIKKIIQIGNASALGANEMLLSMEMRRLAENTANKIKHIRLEFLPDYGERLMLVEQKFGRFS